VISYHSSSSLHVSIPLLPPIVESHLSEFIHEMMVRDPQKRPSITILCPLIQSYCILLESHTLEEVGSMPEYTQWKKLVGKSPKGVQGLLSSLVDWYDAAGKTEAAIQL
jgi:hypothetical protein